MCPIRQDSRWRIVLAALILALTTTQGSAAEATRPNIVIILADDLGYADLGFQGGKDIPTPNLDALAGQGVRCTNGYVTGPYCSPTRAALLTGRYQQRFGHEFNPGEGPAGEFGLPLTQTTLADRLKSAGYATGLVGKWHLGDLPKYHPTKRGFDEFFGFLGGAHPYLGEKGVNLQRGTEAIRESAYLTDAFGREAVAFIDRHQGHPFFLELAFNAVHTPMQASDDRLSRFASIADERRRKYAAMLIAMDEAVGKVLAKLRSAKLEENTLIFFLSDNGGPTMVGTTINASKNDPLRGSKRTTLEGGVRVPFVVRWKGKLPEGKVYDRPLIQLDIMPTALAAAGVAVESSWGLDGVNLLPHLNGESKGDPHDALFWRLGEQAAIRRGDWKLVRYDQTADTSKPARGGRPPVTPFRLYDLNHDIGESHDLSAEKPEKVKELREAWDAWNAQLARPLWGPGSQAASR